MNVITTGISAELARDIATETYIWGYPLIVMELTGKLATNIEDATSAWGRAPINQFAHTPTLIPTEYRESTRGDNDTVFDSAWLDLGAEPFVLTLPKTDRFHILQMCDAWQEVFAAPGTRMTLGAGGNYLIVGPGWQGEVPQGMELLRSPTDHVWLLGRILTTIASDPTDYDFVHKIQAQMKLVPLSQWGKDYVPPKGKIDPTVDMKTPPTLQVGKMSAEAFFTDLMERTKKDPPAIYDQAIVARMKLIGLEPGKSLDFKALPAPIQQALKDGAQDGLKAVRKRATNLGTRKNSWVVNTGAVGYFGADYLFRAAFALYGTCPNRPEDAIYMSVNQDGDGQPLSGANRYVLTFAKGQTPPADAFWSLAMYDQPGFRVPNRLNRSALGNRDKLKFNDDGSLTIYIQHESPGADKEVNWLPAPESGFDMVMRAYLPRPEITSGEWVPPAVTKARTVTKVKEAA